MTRKQQLARELEIEMNRLNSRGMGIADHILTLEYLEKGELPRYDPDDYGYELLSAAINDFECLCNDYGV